MSQPAGLRNQVIQLQRIIRTVDGNGVRGESWITYATCFAEQKTQTYQDTERAGTFGNTGRATWAFNFYPGITTLDRVLFNGAIFNIQDVDDPSQLHRDTVLTCTEQK